MSPKIIKPAYPELQKGGYFNLLAIDDMAKVFFNTEDEIKLEQGMQNLWRQKGNRFSYNNTMIAFVNGQPAGAISCLPYDMLESQTLATVEQIVKIQKLQIVPQFINNFKAIVALINLDEGSLGEYHVSMLATLSQFRGIGIAKNLLTYAEQLALHKGYDIISLTVEINNTSAQRLYQKQGYDYVGEIGEGDIKVYKMRKYLS